MRDLKPGRVVRGQHWTENRGQFTGSLVRMARLRISIVFESDARIRPGNATSWRHRDTGSVSAAARDIGKGNEANAGSQRTRRWRERDSNPLGPSPWAPLSRI